MEAEQQPFDISDVPELGMLVDEAERTGRPRLLVRGSRPVALLIPADVAGRMRSVRSPRQGLAVIERTAGIFRHAAKQPPASIEEETAAFEQAVAARATRSGQCPCPPQR